MRSRICRADAELMPGMPEMLLGCWRRGLGMLKMLVGMRDMLGDEDVGSLC